MPRELRPPKDLKSHEYVVLIYDRDVQDYILSLRDGSTFRLGEAPEAYQYVKRELGEQFGGDVVDMATNFFAIQIIPAEGRMYSIDLPTKRTEREILFGIPAREEDVPIA